MRRTNWWMVSTLILVGLVALVIVAGLMIQGIPSGREEGWRAETQPDYEPWDWAPWFSGFWVLKAVFGLLMPVACFTMFILAIIGCARKAFWRGGPELHWRREFDECPRCGRPAKAEWSLCPHCGSDLRAQRAEG